MVTTPKAPSAAAAADKAMPKKTAATKPVAAKPVETQPTAVQKVATKKVAVKAAEPKPVVAKPAAAKPVAAPPPVAPVVQAIADKPVVKKVPTAKTKLMASTAPKPVLNTEQRNHYVAVAAFYIAERRGFTLGNPTEDWLAAEAEVDRLIASGHFIA